MPEKTIRLEAVHTELAETAQHLKEANNDPQLRLAVLHKMRELLNEADQSSKDTT